MKTRARAVLFMTAVILLLGFSMRVKGATTSYTYDSLHRVIQVTSPNGSVITYTYDAAGNQLTQSHTGSQSPTPTPVQGPCTFYEAESSSNTLTGAAGIQTCPTCSGGEKVGYVGNNSGTLQFNGISANASGTHVVTIYYTNGDPVRTAYVSVNGGAGSAINFPSTGSFNTVGSLQTTISLNAGSNNTVRFYNPTSGHWAPDFDRLGVDCH